MTLVKYSVNDKYKGMVTNETALKKYHQTKARGGWVFYGHTPSPYLDVFTKTYLKKESAHFKHRNNVKNCPFCKRLEELKRGKK